MWSAVSARSANSGPPISRAHLKDLINCSRNSKTKAKQCIIDVVVGLVFYKRSHSHRESHRHENADDDTPFAWPCSLTLAL